MSPVLGCFVEALFDIRLGAACSSTLAELIGSSFLVLGSELVKAYHGPNRYPSPSQVDVSADFVQIGGATLYPLVKAHGEALRFPF